MRKVKIYRFYNMNKSEYGEPFSLCDKHRETQRCPDSCAIIKLADKSIESCIKCEES